MRQGVEESGQHNRLNFINCCAINLPLVKRFGSEMEPPEWPDSAAAVLTVAKSVHWILFSEHYSASSPCRAESAVQ